MEIDISVKKCYTNKACDICAKHRNWLFKGVWGLIFSRKWGKFTATID